MSEEEGLQALHDLYRDNPVIGEGKTEDEFVEYHKTRIKMKNKGYWVDKDGDEYIASLSQQI